MDIRLDWKLAPDAGRRGAADGLTRAVEHVAAVVTDRTPLEDGDLRASRTVHHATPGNLEAGISFGSVYARRQHELVTGNRHTPGTTSHYLSGPWREEAATMQALIAEGIRAALDG